MEELNRNLFASFFVELVVVVLAILLKDDKRKVAAVLAIGTLIVGFVGFREYIFQYLSKNVSSFASMSFPTQQPEIEFRTISLESYSELSSPETNLGLRPGINYLLDIPFEIGWSASTQCSHLPNQPESYQVNINVKNPTDVYLLEQAGYGFAEYNGVEIGSVRLNFSDESTLDTHLILGVNIRDWAWESSAVVRTTLSPSVRPAWTGSAPDGTPGGIDLLTIHIPNNQQVLNLTSVQIVDISQQTMGNINPCIHLLALTIKHIR